MALSDYTVLFIESLIRWDLSGKRVGAVNVTPSPVAKEGSVPGARGFHASHAALFVFVRSQSYLFTIHSCLRATARPCIANREPSRPPPHGANPQGKNRYLSLYIDVGICIYV